MEEKPLSQCMDEPSLWALLARMHRNGVLYVVVPLALALSLPIGLRLPLPTLLGPFSIHLGFAELAALLLSIPMLFAVLNPSGIVRGLASVSLGFALASIGINSITGDVRFVFGQPTLWEGLPVGTAFAGLLVTPIGAALALAGYRGRWGFPVRVTAGTRAFLLLAGSALLVWAVAEMASYRHMPFAILGLAFAGSAFLCSATNGHDCRCCSASPLESERRSRSSVH